LIGASTCWAILGGGFSAAILTTDAGLDGVAVEEAQLAAVQANISSPINSPISNAVSGPVNSQLAHYTLAGGEVSSLDAEEANLHVNNHISVKLDNVPKVKPETAVTSLENEKPAYSGSFFTPPVHAAGDTIVGAKADFRLEAIEDSWVRLANSDGTEIWSGILRQGQTYRPQTSGLVLLSTSNAGGVKLQVGTDTASILGGRGEIISAVRLEETALLTAHDDVLVSALGSR
ncbi:MAG: DUF4115 domain-containing protein, partial [Kordiimonadaceae bacterium]|nr:DUF4115 domain-containing protein [Kordiimonadaceae bacterium]